MGSQATVATVNEDTSLRRCQKNVGLMTNTEGTTGKSEAEDEENEEHPGTEQEQSRLQVSCLTAASHLPR